MNEAQQNQYDQGLRNLQYHKPTSQLTQDAMGDIREAAHKFLAVVCETVPAGRELAMTITEIELACMYGIAGLARNEETFLDTIA